MNEVYDITYGIKNPNEQQIIWVIRKLIIDKGSYSILSDDTHIRIKNRIHDLTGTIFLHDDDPNFINLEQVDPFFKFVVVEDIHDNHEIKNYFTNY